VDHALCDICLTLVGVGSWWDLGGFRGSGWASDWLPCGWVCGWPFEGFAASGGDLGWISDVDRGLSEILSTFVGAGG